MVPFPGKGPAGRVRTGLHLVITVSHGFETYLAGQPQWLARRFDVTLISAPSAGLEAAGRAEGVRTRAVPMTRTISPARDVGALLRLYRIFRRDRPALVQSYSPKAGLLAMVAAWAAQVPVRVHGIIGMPLMEAGGVRARLLRWTERLTYVFATHLTCNSASLRDWIEIQLSRRRIEVIGHGSINGVDTGRLRPPTEVERRRARAELGLDADACVFAFVGRVARDKGVAELCDAFAALPAGGPAQLLIVGGDEDSLAAELHDRFATHPDVIRVGWRTDVRPAYWAADVLVLPSYREGMPNVLLEAAATGLPLVATDIGGCNEIIRHGENGLLVPVKDSAALAAAMDKLREPAPRLAMGARGRQRVVRDYDHETFCRQLLSQYCQWVAV